MAPKLNSDLRAPDGYVLARRAIGKMEQAGVWPTPLNFELWLHYLGEPKGELAAAIDRLLAEGHAITDDVAETLAAQYLSRLRLSDEIQDAGAQLSRELSSVAGAIARARKSQAAYGAHLAEADHSLTSGSGDVQQLVSGLAQATRKVQAENASLEQRLQDSTREVARLRDHLEQVRRDAMTDALTNLANRKAFDEELARLCTADGSGGPVSLAVLDIDHFKRFNDTWGHQTGDQVLRYVASVIGRAAVAPRLAARFGGEEFALIFPGDAPSVVMNTLESLRTEIASRGLRRRSTNEELGAVTISIGVAQRELSEPPTALLERADAALYASKRGGRNMTSVAPGRSRAA